MKEHLEQKNSHIQRFIFNTAMLLELLVALIVIAALLIMFTHVPIYFRLIGIIAIALLFLVRKYLFVSALDKIDDK